MLTLKKVKELVGAPSHAKRTPSPKMLYEEGIVLLRREFDQGSHLTVYNSGYVLFSAGKRNTVFHIHDCCGDYAYDAAEGKGDVIEEEYFENCEWHIPKSRMKRGSALFGSWETFPAWSFLPVNLQKAGTFGATRSNAALLLERRKQSMAFVPVPKDLNRVKTKVMFNLTKRQLICFSIAAAVGVPIFFLAKAHLDLSTAAMLMVVIMLPFIFFALYEKDGQPAEKYLYHIVQSMFIRDKVRPYRTNNLYAEIQQKIKEQEELQLEQQHSKGKA